MQAPAALLVPHSSLVAQTPSPAFAMAMKQAQPAPRRLLPVLLPDQVPVLLAAVEVMVSIHGASQPEVQRTSADTVAALPKAYITHSEGQMNATSGDLLGRAGCGIPARPVL